MAVDLKVVELECFDVTKVAEQLRELAKTVESGGLGAAHNVAWVCDCGDGTIAVGMCGQSFKIAPEAHFLLSLGIRKLESVGE